MQSSFIPALLFGFSNNNEYPLPMLQKESGYIWQMLKGREKQNAVKVIREESMTNEDLMDHLVTFRKELTVLHFGGHADGQVLATEEEATAPRGLKKVLEQLPNLKLVVLNACSTALQAEMMLEAGIPMVVATTLPVEDEKAAWFARAFYGQLASGEVSPKAAFETAIGIVASIKEWGLESHVDSADRLVPYTRGLALRLEESPDTPWQFFFREDLSDELNYWRLVEPIENSSPMGNVQNLAINAEIVAGHLEVIKAQSEKITRKVKEYLDDLVHQLDKKIQLVLAGEDLSQAILQRQLMADVFRGIRERTDDALIGSILATVETHLRQILGQKAQFMDRMKRAGVTEAEKKEMATLLRSAQDNFSMLRDML